jgi:hypothetical protein
MRLKPTDQSCVSFSQSEIQFDSPEPNDRHKSQYIVQPEMSTMQFNEETKQEEEI